MTPEELKDQLILFDKDQLLHFLEERNKEIRLLFLQAKNDVQTSKTFQQIILRLTSLRLPENIKTTLQVQSFFTQLAFYFKRINIQQFVETCYNHILESVFRRRLDAWLYYKRYHDQKSNIQLFENYMQILSSARYEDDDDYTYNLLGDLQDYKDFIDNSLNPEIRVQVNQLFESPDLQSKYMLLKIFEEQKSDRMPGLQIKEYDQKEYEPSEFMQLLFRNKFLNYVKEKSQPNFPGYLFGYHKETVIYEIIKQGQANFDEQFENLEPRDIVKLYCYFNMRKHYFTSLSLYERSLIIDRFYNAGGRIHFIDIGCGPATSGLAFLEYLRQEDDVPVMFEYYGIDISKAMKEEAGFMLENEIFHLENGKAFKESVLEIDLDDFKNATCIILNTCYVFASSTLQVDELVSFVKDLRAKYPHKPKYLLFQNPNKERLNRKYSIFKEAIGGYTIDFSEVETIYYHTQRGQYVNVKNEPVYFEILKL
jgi:SAM-dependent methyltransferase